MTNLDDFAPSTPSRRPRRWWLVAGIAAAVVLVGAAIAVAAGSGDDRSDRAGADPASADGESRENGDSPSGESRDRGSGSPTSRPGETSEGGGKDAGDGGSRDGNDGDGGGPSGGGPSGGGSPGGGSPGGGSGGNGTTGTTTPRGPGGTGLVTTMQPSYVPAGFSERAAATPVALCVDSRPRGDGRTCTRAASNVERTWAKADHTVRLAVVQPLDPVAMNLDEMLGAVDADDLRVRGHRGRAVGGGNFQAIAWPERDDLFVSLTASCAAPGCTALSQAELAKLAQSLTPAAATVPAEIPYAFARTDDDFEGEPVTRFAYAWLPGSDDACLGVLALYTVDLASGILDIGTDAASDTYCQYVEPEDGGMFVIEDFGMLAGTAPATTTRVKVDATGTRDAETAPADLDLGGLKVWAVSFDSYGADEYLVNAYAGGDVVARYDPYGF